MKAKLSVTIDAAVAEELDRFATTSSRSQVVEWALASWFRGQRLRELEDEIERYYREIPPEERTEDEAWAQLGLSHTRETWS